VGGVGDVVSVACDHIPHRLPQYYTPACAGGEYYRWMLRVLDDPRSIIEHAYLVVLRQVLQPIHPAGDQKNVPLPDGAGTPGRRRHDPLQGLRDGPDT